MPNIDRIDTPSCELMYLSSKWAIRKYLCRRWKPEEDRSFYEGQGHAPGWPADKQTSEVKAAVLWMCLNEPRVQKTGKYGRV